MKKFIVILLALVMVLSVFASCGGNQGATTPQKTTPKPSDPGTGGDVTVEVPEDEQINLDLDTIDYEGETVHIFHWEGNAADFGMEQDDIGNDAIYDATYRRNLQTETDLGIELDWYKQTNSNYPKSVQFVDRLTARVADPNTPVDIIISGVRSMPFFLVEGHLTELNTYSDSLDLEKAWWPKNIQDAIAIKGNLYFVSGDIAASLLQCMTVLFVNKTMLEQRGHNYIELMEKVKTYQWTLDDLIALTENTYMDLDTVVGPSEGDQFGLITLYYHSDALYTGLGYNYMVKSNKDEEAFRFSSNMTTATVSNYVQKMKDWQLDNDFYMKYLDPQEAGFAETFNHGLSLFLLHRAAYGFELQKTDIKYAVLPAPALDKAQGEYFVNVNSSYSVYGICKSSLDYDLSAQTLQVLGYHAFSTTTPAVFEVSFQGKFAKDDYTIEMFDIIRESIVFDTGRVYDVYIATQEVGFDWEFLEYIIANVVSYGIKGNESGQDTLFDFPNVGNNTRMTLTRCLKSANTKIMDYIDSQS